MRPEGIEIVRAAAVREDASEKHAVTPGPLKPAREILGDLFMQAGKPADALREYEAVIAKEPTASGPPQVRHERPRRQATRRRPGSTPKRVVALTATADTVRPDIAQAKRIAGI